MVSRPKLRLFRYLVPVIVVLAFIFSFRQCGKQEKPAGHPRDYAAIAKEGIIRVATEYNSISFYVDSDTVSGFHYELIQAFARDKGLKAEITPIMSFEERLEGLSEGRYDVIAYGILATSKLKDSLLLTSPIFLNKQVLVQRKEIDKYGSEQLISMVAHGDIDYAVCDESIALAAADSLPQIDINTAISFTQFYSWAVSKQSPVLLDSLNTWLDKFQKEEEYQKIYKKYYDKE